MSDQKYVDVYTDGACKFNPGPGGWAWVQMDGDKPIDRDCGNDLETTNNRMEMTAFIKVLEKFVDTHNLRIYTDSKYVMDGITDWMPNKWTKTLDGEFVKKKDGKPVLNSDLWVEIEKLWAQRKVKPVLEWVKGHSTSIGNKHADKLAQNQAQAQA